MSEWEGFPVVVRPDIPPDEIHAVSVHASAAGIINLGQVVACTFGDLADTIKETTLALRRFARVAKGMQSPGWIDTDPPQWIWPSRIWDWEKDGLL
jgi:hypothetical protein